MNQKGWKEFITLCLAAKDDKQLSEIFDLFLTLEEKESLAMRLLIVKELLTGKKTQRQIAKDLNVSIAKITRGSNALKLINPHLLKLLKRKF